MESSIIERAREFMESSRKRQKKKKKNREKKMRELESFWNQVEVKGGKKRRKNKGAFGKWK